MYDIANSGNAAVVSVAVFRACVAGVVADTGPDRDAKATLLWTLSVLIVGTRSLR